MTLHGREYEAGVRELHDRLSENLERVQRGGQVVVTHRGRPIARLSAIASDGGSPPARATHAPRARARRSPGAREARGSVAELVAEQRR
jgi:prevent-host-death family protein